MNILKSRNVQRILLAVASVVFVLFCIELPALIGVLDYRTVIGPFHMWWAPNVADPELVAIHRPHARQTGEARGGGAASIYQIPQSDMTLFKWDVKYDHHGFRNAVDLENADIVVIGDSFVEDLTVPYPELMTFRLAQLQGKVTANLGQATYGPLQELIVLKRYGLPLRPRTVIWMFSEESDLGDVTSYRRAMQNKPTFWQAFWARSFTRNARSSVKGFIAPPSKPPGIRYSGVFQTSDGKPVTLYFSSHPPALSKDDLSAIDETAATLATAQKLCADQGARLIFVFVPMKFTVYHSFCQFPPESKCRTWVATDMSQRLQTALASASPEMGYFDLTPALVDAAKRGELTYYPDDVHWSSEGQKVAAEAINSYLLSTGIR